MMQSVGYVLWVAALLNLRIRLLFIFHVQFVHCLSCRSFRAIANVPHTPEEQNEGIEML
jgi:hypothetical protein